jgi:hypothetical protein
MILLIIIFSELWEIFNQKLTIGFSKKLICDWEDFWLFGVKIIPVKIGFQNRLEEYKSEKSNLWWKSSIDLLSHFIRILWNAEIRPKEIWTGVRVLSKNKKKYFKRKNWLKYIDSCWKSTPRIIKSPSAHSHTPLDASSQFIPRIFINPLRVSPKFTHRILKILSAYPKNSLRASSKSIPRILTIQSVHNSNSLHSFSKKNKQLFFG